MANRSYLYSINEVPGEQVDQTLTPKALSEFNWDIPLTFLILVSGNTMVCDSLLDTYPRKICLAGNYQEGLENLLAFGELMKASNIQHSTQFAAQLNTAIAFLSDSKVKQPYTFLELGELYDMGDSIDTESIMFMIEDVAKAIKNKDISQLSLGYYHTNETLFNQWEELLGLDYWSDILYFDFPKPIQYHSPFKKVESNKNQTSPEQKQQNLSALAQAMKDISL